MFTTIKKIVISIVCLTVLSAGLAVPQKTYATVPTIDYILNTVTAAGTAADLAHWVTTVAQWAKNEAFKVLRDKAVKYIVDEINKQTVNWIRGGGEPKFVTDWQGLLKDAATDAVNQTISESKLADLCTPFAPQLRIALIPETRPISKTASCTIAKIVSNVQGFYDNFQNGGWLAYGEAIKPENNLYMQLVMFGDETKLNTNLSQEAKKQEAGAGSGFLSVSTCEEDNSQELFDGCVKNLTDGDPVDACYTYADANKTCTKKKVQTPGAAVGDTVKNMIGSENIFAAGAQSILSAVIDAGLNRMMSEGLALMSPSPRPGQGINVGTYMQADLDVYNAGANSNLKNSLDPILSQWKAILNIKNDSTNYNTALVNDLAQTKQLQDAGAQCPPQVSTQETDSANTMANKLTQDTSTLVSQIAEVQKIFNDIDALGSQSPTVSAEVAAFTQQYIVVDPNGYGLEQQKQDALDERDGMTDANGTRILGIKDKLADALVRLGACQAAQPAP